MLTAHVRLLGRWTAHTQPVSTCSTAASCGAHSQPDPEFPGGQVPVTLGSPSLEKEPEMEGEEWARSAAAPPLSPGCRHGRAQAECRPPRNQASL